MRDNREQESARQLRSGYLAVVFLFHNFVALAREVLEAFAIQYANIAAMVIDKSVLSEAVRRDADACPARRGRRPGARPTLAKGIPESAERNRRLSGRASSAATAPAADPTCVGDYRRQSALPGRTSSAQTAGSID